MQEEKDDKHCHQSSKCFPCITFSAEDMQIKGKHNKPLYYIGYIGSSEVSRIHVDPWSHWALCPVGSCSTWGFPPIDWTLHRLSYMVSMPMVRVRWVISSSDIRSVIWSLKWRVMSSMLTCLTTCSWDDHDSGNEADTKLEPEEEYLWKINSLEMSVHKLDFDAIANVEGEWFINKNLDLTYFSVFAYRQTPVLMYIVTLGRQ